MKKISIVGFGRFGKTLYKLLAPDFDLIIYDPNPAEFTGLKLTKKTKIAQTVQEIYESEAIFYATPISKFEKIIKEHRKYFKNHLLIDVLSVKVYPAQILGKYLKNTKTQALLTHPMFGPDSSKQGFTGLSIAMDKFLCSQENYNFWQKYFEQKGLTVVEISAQKHDKLAANSQGITHFLGRLLNEFHLEPTPIDTLGAQKLAEIKEQTCHDTWELFKSLQTYNPYTKIMRLKLGAAYDKLFNKLLPKKIHLHNNIFGIQGGVGSFNEEALLDYVARHKIKKYKVKYLYTTKKVLEQLKRGNIDYGLFAMHNSVGGVVTESIKALAKFKVNITEEFNILITHFLMKHKQTKLSEIKTIMAHPQVFKQCQDTLKKNYSKYKLISGSGDLIDTANLAKALAEGKIAKNIAILGPQNLSKLYKLEIVAKNLQDNKANWTSFLMVKREK
jgi:arogenate dehydrogenase (NADP+), plant